MRNKDEIKTIQRRLLYYIHLVYSTAYCSTVLSWYILCSNSCMNYTIIPTLSFRSSSIVYYDKIEGFGRSYQMSDLQKQNVQRLKELAKYSGVVTANSKKRMRKAITLLLQSTEFKKVKNKITNRYVNHRLSFMTLTFPKHSFSDDAKECHKRLLEPMLRVLRRRYQMKSYIWKSELQKNGSVHYHITSDVYIPYRLLLEEWNNILSRNGCLDDFRRRYGHINANSVDIKSVNKVRNLEAYLVKYITKECEQQVSLKAKVWDCSRNLKASKFFETEVDKSAQEVINEAVDRKECTVIKLDKCIIFQFKCDNYIKLFSSYVQSQAYLHFKQIRKWTKELGQKVKETVLSCVPISSIGDITVGKIVQKQMNLFTMTTFGELVPSAAARCSGRLLT